MTNHNKLELLLLRHGRTRANLEKRYAGLRSDESLLDESVEELTRTRAELSRGTAPPKVYCSPLRRCVETAAILFPEVEPILVADLREIDFGDFEGKTWQELSDNDAYRRWLDSGGTTPFPNGESRSDFIRRSYDAFAKIVCEDRGAEPFVALVAHGGTLMAILSELTNQDYFAFQTPPAAGWALSLEVYGENIRLMSYRGVCARLDA